MSSSVRQEGQAEVDPIIIHHSVEHAGVLSRILNLLIRRIDPNYDYVIRGSVMLKVPNKSAKR